MKQSDEIIEKSDSIQIYGNRRYTDLNEAIRAFAEFRKTDCTSRVFEFQGSGKYPIDTCFCWQEYNSFTGSLKASARFSLLTLSYNLPFSNLKSFLLRLFGAKIHKSAYFSPRIFVDTLYPDLLTIGKGTLIGTNCEIGLHEHTGNLFRIGKVEIGEGVTVGACSRIRCGVKIGDFAQIAGAAFVMRDVPPHSVVIGNPGRIVRR
ncbi:MAG: hypothetical protein HQM10_11390 [Candidatus Riflebacteria bacterium]|nr:hypothetical protein [Candidatus Riflebacteria bacterium]